MGQGVGVCLLAGMLFAVPDARAELQHYRVNAEESRVDWQAIVNAAPLDGGFGGITGEIAFDAESPAASQFRIEVPLEQVDAFYPEVLQELVKPEWFDTANFPMAVFESREVSRREDGTYQAEGDLRLRGVVQPVRVNFTVEALEKTHASAVGTAEISRLDYGIGQGEWQATDTVGNAVKLRFSVKATAKH